MNIYNYADSLHTGTKSHSAQTGTPGVTKHVCISNAPDKWRTDAVGPRGSTFQWQASQLSSLKWNNGGTLLDLNIFRLGGKLLFHKLYNSQIASVYASG